MTGTKAQLGDSRGDLQLQNQVLVFTQSLDHKVCVQSRMEQSVVKVKSLLKAQRAARLAFGDVYVGHGQVHTPLESVEYWVLGMSTWAGNGDSVEVFIVL